MGQKKNKTKEKPQEKIDNYDTDDLPVIHQAIADDDLKMLSEALELISVQDPKPSKKSKKPSMVMSDVVNQPWFHQRLTPLACCACDPSKTEMLKVLLKHPLTDVNKPCITGHSPLDFMAIYKHERMVAELFMSGKKVDLKPNKVIATDGIFYETNEGFAADLAEEHGSTQALKIINEALRGDHEGAAQTAKNLVKASDAARFLMIFEAYKNMLLSIDSNLNEKDMATATLVCDFMAKLTYEGRFDFFQSVFEVEFSGEEIKNACLWVSNPEDPSISQLL